MTQEQYNILTWTVDSEDSGFQESSRVRLRADVRDKLSIFSLSILSTVQIVNHRLIHRKP